MIVQPVFTGLPMSSRQATQRWTTSHESEPKPQYIDQQCIVYNYKCDQCDAGYVGTPVNISVRTRRMTFAIVLMCWKKFQNKFDYVAYEMLLIKSLYSQICWKILCIPGFPVHLKTGLFCLFWRQT